MILEEENNKIERSSPGKRELTLKKAGSAV